MKELILRVVKVLGIKPLLIAVSCFAVFIFICYVMGIILGVVINN